MLAELAATLELDGRDYAALADRVRASFRAAFWREEAGCLRDVISGTGQDEQIRCNQIWAVAQPFPLLDPGQEVRVVATVQRELYTPVGLRTLAPGDTAFHPVYGGPQKERDLAYHQGTPTLTVFCVLLYDCPGPTVSSSIRKECSTLQG